MVISIVGMNNTSKDQTIKARYYLYRISGKKFSEGEKYKETRSTLIMFNNYRNEKLKDLQIVSYKLNKEYNKVKKLKQC